MLGGEAEAMNGESANKFISALVKSLQTLCHGYVEFNDGIEIIGHLYLNIDSGSSFDYVVKEKVCKNAENSTVFVSKSFQAQGPAEELITRKDKDDEAAVFEDSSNMSPTTGTTRLQSAITSISNVLSGTQQEGHKSRLLDHNPSPQNTGKRKREHNGNYNSMLPPYKYTTLQSSTASSGYFNSAQSSKQAADRNHSEHFSNTPHAEFFGGDSNQSSGMGQEDEDDLDLDVTFVKEEYESQRNSSQRGAASRLSQDPSTSQPNMIHDGSSIGYTHGHQQFGSSTTGDLGNMSQSFQDPTQIEIGQQGPPNPRNDARSRSRERDSQTPSVELDLSSGQPIKFEDLSGMSDTLQLGIKLFGPKFVADVASGDLSLIAVSSDSCDKNRIEMPESSSVSVFPDMFDMKAVSDSSIKQSQNVLWHDRKEKMKRSFMGRKGNRPKLRSRASSRKTDSDHFTHPNIVTKTINKIPSEQAGSLDQYGQPFKRKRGRPPTRNKIFKIDDCLLGSPGKGNIEHGKSLNEKCIAEEAAPPKGYPGSLSPQDSVAPKRILGEGTSRRIRGSYRQYTPADKLEIVDFGIKYGSTAASRKYNIPESTVRSWTKKMDTFLMQMNMSELPPQLSSLINRREQSETLEEKKLSSKPIATIPQVLQKCMKVTPDTSSEEGFSVEKLAQFDVKETVNTNLSDNVIQTGSNSLTKSKEPTVAI